MKGMNLNVRQNKISPIFSMGGSTEILRQFLFAVQKPQLPTLPFCLAFAGGIPYN